MYPDKGHIVGGTTVTIYGGGFIRGLDIKVQFSHASGEVDQVPAKFIDSGRITCVTPERNTPHDAHVAVSNNGVTFSSFPLVADDEGTYLYFAFVNTQPQGHWTIDNATGPVEGGTAVTIHNDAQHTSSRLADLNFLPGTHLRCRFGNTRNVTQPFVYNVSVARKTTQHPWFGVGNDNGYVITGERGYRGYAQGMTITLVRGRTYTFNLDAAGFPFYFTAAEPHVWSPGDYVREYTKVVYGSRLQTGTLTFTVDAGTPDRLYYMCGDFPYMGGQVNVVNSMESRVTTETLQNAVPAKWLSYNRIRCVTPPWDGATDDNPLHGGHQVTVFVTNDGHEYSAGYGGSDGTNEGPLPEYVGKGATFTYFGTQPFRDAVQFSPAKSVAEGAVSVAGGSEKNPRSVGYDTFAHKSTTFHSYSDVYNDRGELRGFKLNASKAAAEAVKATEAAVNNTRGPKPEPQLFYGISMDEFAQLERQIEQEWLLEGSLRNDIVVTGEYNGDGLAWYEIVIDGVDSVRWRLHHGHVNSSGPWWETFVPLPTNETMTAASGSGSSGAGAGIGPYDDVEGSLSLGHGLRIHFLRRGPHHVLGDRWTFRVYGGKPMVTGAVTSHNEPQFSARGPFEGNTEITVLGNSFFPGEKLRCRLYDADTGIVMVLQGHYDSMRRVRCITQRHEPRAGGELVATVRPCMFKTVQVSHNGGVTWSTASANVRFLFCDIYVSTTGSDVAGHGTPDRPYATLQRAIEAALGHPRAYYTYAPEDFTSKQTRGSSMFAQSRFGVARPRVQNKGFGYYINRDRVVVDSGVYTGSGNYALHPLGKMLELSAKVRLTVVIDCGQTGFGATVPTGDRHATEDVTNTGSISFFGIQENSCNQQTYFPKPT